MTNGPAHTGGGMGQNAPHAGTVRRIVIVDDDEGTQLMLADVLYEFAKQIVP